MLFRDCDTVGLSFQPPLDLCRPKKTLQWVLRVYLSLNMYCTPGFDNSCFDSSTKDFTAYNFIGTIISVALNTNSY